MKRAWWKEAVVYQIYPRSFFDTDGDGIGDLKGITAKLDYLKNLGVDVVWLSPIYESPNDDNGYDISNYMDIMKDFGTMADFDEMLSGMHARGIKLVMDLVANHTSDEHPWFVESRSAKENEYRDYYIWKPAQEDGREPNNWLSFFSGSAWEFDETTNEYYLHLFSRKQPDLNWENEKVRQEVYKMMTFWLDKGIDGFRMDVINAISKVPGLPNAPAQPGERYAWGGQYFINGPRVHEFIQEMHEQVLSKYNLMTVGETGGVTPLDAILYADEDRGELNMVFQFEHMDLDSGPGGKWDLKPWRLADLKEVMTRWQQTLYGKAWNSLYLNNHDQPRAVSRFGSDTKYRVESAKMLATFLHMQQGTPYIYQGEEIGMTNVRFDSIEDYRDVEILNLWRERVVQRGDDVEGLLHAIHVKGRDNARTPMQWSDQSSAGFTEGTPWIAINPNYPEINVEQALEDRDSIFYYYRKLIQLRHENPVIVYGKYELILADDPEIYAYTRTLDDEILLVINNFFDGTPVFKLPVDLPGEHKGLLIANYDVEATAGIGEIQLRPYEARVYKLT